MIKKGKKNIHIFGVISALYPHRILIKRILMSVILLFFTCFFSSALAESPQDPSEIQKIQQEIKALEESIKIFSDKKARKELVNQLETIMSVKRDIISKKTIATPIEAEKKTLNVIKLYENISQKFHEKFKNIKTGLNRLPKDYAKLKAFLSKEENLNRLFDLVLKLIILILIYGFFLFFLKKATKMLKLQKEKTYSFSGKIKTFGLNVFFKSYRIVILFFFSWIFLKVFFQETVVSSILYTFGAWLVYQILKSFFRSLFTPEDPRDRLLLMDEQLAGYILVWCNRILLFSLWMFILVKIFFLFGFEQISGAFESVYRIGLLIMLAIILAQRKEDIQKKLILHIKEEEPVWKVRCKNIYNRFIGTIYLVLIVYFAVIVLSYVFGYKKIYQFFLSATLQSIMTLVLAAFVWFFWNKVFQKLFAISEEIKTRYPALEKQVNQYTNWIHKLIHFLIILFAFIFFLNIWGADIFGFLSTYSSYIFRLTRIPIIVFIAIIFIQVITFLIQKTLKRVAALRIKKEGARPYEVEKQMATTGTILRKTLVIAVWFVTGMMVLKELGFSIGPLLAGAGIIGLAVGFGSQNLVRDVISGLFMIVENQVRVGDVAILNGTGGLVEQVNLRTTVLRGLDGTVHVFPNGTINTVSNMTHDFSYYLFDIGVAYKEDVDCVCKVLMEISDRIIQEEPYKSAILEPLEILGLDKFADSAIIIKARIKTQPIKQWMVGREMNRRIKKRFDEVGIEIPFPHRTFYFGEVSKPIEVSMPEGTEFSGKLKEFIQKAIRETMKGEENKRDIK